ncbi:triose-phosphate isomerase [Pseudoalteromonas denitrificans]|uniref:Triosephosphate isomerase n=1 Tax=Pseudoalteromonas denitrificans DSM 6059 TaxID=1123010 RepID=A0A1I1F3J3_9GAMM|nr:triose-phosphate isomerase [Pseudoalteromonas denitrificans]SFB91730.1 triosephosphate isomerase [Pseudoalteromonas denitrificans DSM 6059]
MASRKPMVAGNWKMNGSVELITTMADTLKNASNNKIDVLIFPPFPLLSKALEADIVAGSQTVSHEDAGAFTGEVDAKLVFELGCKYTLVGHSERRSIYGESNDVVALKFEKAQENKLIPILCVGESETQREQGLTESVVAEQLNVVIDKLGVAALVNSVIAYEPVWAIGTGKTASPKQAQEVHKFIRNKIAALDMSIAENITLLYGGSVNDQNSELLFAQADIDGGLIGGASLKPDAFLSICNSAQRNA